MKGRLDPKTRIRKLEAIDLWEISIVTFPLLAGARLALASHKRVDARLQRAMASGQRERSTGPAPDPRVASLGLAAREVRAVKDASSPPSVHARTRNSFTRQSWPVDRSLMRFTPERLFRKEPRFRIRRQSEIAAAQLARR